MTGILIIQNHEKSFLCLERARNLLQNGICKKAQHVVGQETQELNTGIDFIYATLILLFFTVNYELLYERNNNYVHKPLLL